LQIKMAQGAKPGEGGELPGKKVFPEIAKVRGTTPGVGLISPPPHHDIYSIEDLAELIHDLKNSNHHARISVKLVAEVGVGTVAAGVAKAHADVVLISGHDGGTGASPQSASNTRADSVGTWPGRNAPDAGAEQFAQPHLRRGGRPVENGPRRGGRRVAGRGGIWFCHRAAGVLGCIMMRVCHLNTCPVGVATQDPELRKRFTGDPGSRREFHEIHREEVREFMAQAWFSQIKDMVGRTDKLGHGKPSSIGRRAGSISRRFCISPKAGPEVGRFCQIDQDHGLEKSLDNTTLLLICAPALERGEKVAPNLPIINVNRVVGTILGSEITRRTVRRTCRKTRCI
jgi:glutamate synthase (ferredoxin)